MTCMHVKKHHSLELNRAAAEAVEAWKILKDLVKLQYNDSMDGTLSDHIIKLE